MKVSRCSTVRVSQYALCWLCLFPTRTSLSFTKKEVPLKLSIRLIRVGPDLGYQIRSANALANPKSLVAVSVTLHGCNPRKMLRKSTCPLFRWLDIVAALTDVGVASGGCESAGVGVGPRRIPVAVVPLKSAIRLLSRKFKPQQVSPSCLVYRMSPWSCVRNSTFLASEIEISLCRAFGKGFW